MLAAALVVAASVALATAFLATRSADEGTLAGASVGVTITEFDRDATSATLYRRLEVAARAGGVAVYRRAAGSTPDAADFFVFPARSAPYAPGADYPSFSRRRVTTFHPASALGSRDVRGQYFLVGDADASASTIARIERAGFTVEVDRYDDWSSVTYLVETSVLPQLAMVIWLCLTVLFGYVALGRAKAAAVRTLHGHRAAMFVARSVFGTLGLAAAVLAVMSTLTVAALWVYNDLHQFGRFAAIAWPLLVGTAAVALLSDLVGTVVAARQPPARSLYGDSATGSVYDLSKVAKVLVVVALVTVCGATLAARDERGQARTVGGPWAHEQGRVALGHAGLLQSYSSREEAAYGRRFRGFLVDADRANRAVLSATVGDPSVARRNYTPSSGNVLVVNDAYLRRYPVAASTGEDVHAPRLAPDQAVLLIPQASYGRRHALARQFREWFQFQASLDGRVLTRRAPRLSAVAVPDGVARFNYRSVSEAGLAGAQSTDAVLLVVGTDSDLLSNDFYAAASTRGQVLLDDAARTRADLDAHGLAQEVPMLYDVADVARDELQRLDTTFALNGALGLLVLAASVLASSLLTAVYCDRNRRRILLERLHGWPAARRHRLLAGGVLLAYLAVVGVYAAKLSSPAHGLALGLTVVLLADAALAVRLVQLHERRSTVLLLKQGS